MAGKYQVNSEGDGFHSEVIVPIHESMDPIVISSCARPSSITSLILPAYLTPHVMDLQAAVAQSYHRIHALAKVKWGKSEWRS